MGGFLITIMLQLLLLLTSRAWAESVFDGSCTDPEIMDESVALDMKVQLLQTNDVPSNPKQIRLQAQQKRTKLMVEEAQKWNALKRVHKEEIAAARLAEVRDRELMREIHSVESEDDEQDDEDDEESEDDEQDDEDSDESDYADDDSDIDDEAQLVMDDNETEPSSLYAHISTEKRTNDEQKVLELQRNKRTRALKRRAMQKHRSARHPHVESLGQKEAEEAANVLAARDAALATATQVMEAQGITPETIKAAEDLVSRDTMSLLEEPQNVSAPSNMRAQLARQMLSEQEEQRAFAKKLRMAAAGTSEEKQQEQQQQALEELEKQKKKEEEEKAEEKSSSETGRKLPTPAELRSQVLHEKLEEQAAMRSAAAKAKMEVFANKHAPHSQQQKEDSPPIQAFAIQPASSDVKLSPAARRNQVRRLSQAYKKALSDSAHEK